MKKFLSAALACLTAGALFVGCGSDSTSSNKIKIGVIAGLNVAEQKYNDMMQQVEEFAKGKVTKHQFIYYDGMHSMQMSLDSGNVDELNLYKSVADYLIARNPDVMIIDAHKMQVPLKDKFCCAVKSDNKELLDAINGAIAGMKDDGTLDALTKKYIVELKVDEEPQAVEMPMIEGADTIKVAVTGDLPPLDLIRADGTPAGFNTAVLAEIGKRISKNIELVSVDSVARSTALVSGKADIIFWVRVPNDNSILTVDFDRPKGIAISDYYFVDESVHVGKKK